MAERIRTLLKTGRIPGFIFAIAAFAAVALLLPAGLTAAAPETDVPPDLLESLLPNADYAVGDIAVPFSAPTLSGKTINLDNYFGEKVTVVAFWLSGCDLCIKEMRLLQQYIKKGKLENKVAVLTVARAKNPYEKNALKNKIKANKITWPVILDPDLAISKRFNIAIVPSFVLVDRNGKIATPPVFHIKTPMRDMPFEKFIDLALSGKKIPPIQFQKKEYDSAFRGFVGKKAADFTAKTIDGAAFSSTKFRGNKRLVLVFWHPDNSTSASILRQVKEFSDAYAKKYDFQVAGLSYLYGQRQLESVKEYRESHGIKFPLINDAGGKAGAKYHVSTVPTIFIIDRDGRIIDVISDSRSDVISSLEIIFQSLK